MNFRNLIYFFLVVGSLNLAKGQDVSILFVGNSLTYQNNLPAMIERIGSIHKLNILTKCICYPNYGLEDHWMNGQLQEELRSHKYEFVVFQQGPSSQEDGRSSLIKYGGYISSLARESHATPVYFMVWPSLGYYHTFPLVIENYEKAANENDALLIPVGRSWKQIHDGIPGSGLYAQDNFHPSEKGSRLAALITYATLFGEMNLEKLKKRFLKDFNPEELRTF